MWLLVIVIIVGMLFVMLHKPAVNTTGVGWTPPPIDPPASPTAHQGGVAQPQAQAPVEVGSFDLNDLYGAKKPPNQPNA